MKFKRFVIIFDDFYKIANKSALAAEWIVSFSKDFISKANIDFVYVFNNYLLEGDHLGANSRVRYFEFPQIN